MPKKPLIAMLKTSPARRCAPNVSGRTSSSQPIERLGAEKWKWTPVPKTTTATQGAHCAQGRAISGAAESTRLSGVNPTSVAPAARPKASSTSWTRPVMSRLVPAIMSP